MNTLNTETGEVIEESNGTAGLPAVHPLIEAMNNLTKTRMTTQAVEALQAIKLAIKSRDEARQQLGDEIVELTQMTNNLLKVYDDADIEGLQKLGADFRRLTGKRPGADEEDVEGAANQVFRQRRAKS